MDPTATIRILQVTDTHLRAAQDGELYGVRTNASFRAVMERALGDVAWRPAAVLVTGDLAEDPTREVYERFRAAVSSLAMPILCLPGNHDDPAVMAQVLDGSPLSYCGSWSANGWRLVLLDTVVPGEAGGFLKDGELARLQRTLEAASGQWVLVAVHHQPLPMGSAWLDELGLRNGPALLSLLGEHRHARAVVWGHVHQASDRHHLGLRMLSTPSTCAQFTPATPTCVMDLRPPGFRRLELCPDGEIRSDVVWLDDWAMHGRPPDSRAMRP